MHYASYDLYIQYAKILRYIIDNGQIPKDIVFSRILPYLGFTPYPRELVITTDKDRSTAYLWKEAYLLWVEHERLMKYYSNHVPPYLSRLPFDRYRDVKADQTRYEGRAFRDTKKLNDLLDFVPSNIFSRVMEDGYDIHLFFSGVTEKYLAQLKNDKNFIGGKIELEIIAMIWQCKIELRLPRNKMSGRSSVLYNDSLPSTSPYIVIEAIPAYDGNHIIAYLDAHETALLHKSTDTAKGACVFSAFLAAYKRFYPLTILTSDDVRMTVYNKLYASSHVKNSTVLPKDSIGSVISHFDYMFKRGSIDIIGLLPWNDLQEELVALTMKHVLVENSNIDKIIRDIVTYASSKNIKDEIYHHKKYLDPSKGYIFLYYYAKVVEIFNLLLSTLKHRHNNCPGIVKAQLLSYLPYCAGLSYLTYYNINDGRVLYFIALILKLGGFVVPTTVSIIELFYISQFTTATKVIRESNLEIIANIQKEFGIVDDYWVFYMKDGRACKFSECDNSKHLYTLTLLAVAFAWFTLPIILSNLLIISGYHIADLPIPYNYLPYFMFAANVPLSLSVICNHYELNKYKEHEQQHAERLIKYLEIFAKDVALNGNRENLHDILKGFGIKENDIWDLYSTPLTRHIKGWAGSTLNRIYEYMAYILRSKDVRKYLHPEQITGLQKILLLKDAINFDTIYAHHGAAVEAQNILHELRERTRDSRVSSRKFLDTPHNLSTHYCLPKCLGDYETTLLFVWHLGKRNVETSSKGLEEEGRRRYSSLNMLKV